MNEYTETNDRGDMYYYKDKERKILHRIDGPAVEWANGFKAWFVGGIGIFAVDGDGNITSRMR